MTYHQIFSHKTWSLKSSHTFALVQRQLHLTRNACVIAQKLQCHHFLHDWISFDEGFGVSTWVL